MAREEGIRRLAAKHDFQAEALELRAGLDGPDRFHVLHSLRALEEDWARALLGRRNRGRIATMARARAKAGIDPAVASVAGSHLAAAEKCQREIASYATAGAEGLGFFAPVRELQVAQAWLLAARARATGRVAEVRRALSVAAEVEGDSNGFGSAHAASLRDLRAWVRRRR